MDLIVLVRHPAVAVAPGVCYGRLDVTLAEPATVPLAGFAGTVWTSPAQRCRAVAAAIGPHQVDLRLQEMDFGAWEGSRWDDVPRAELDHWAADIWQRGPPDGETGAALVARVTAFHDGLPRGDHLVVTHGGPLKVLGALLRGVPVDLAAAAPALGSVQRFRR